VEISGDKTADAGTIQATMSTFTPVAAFKPARYVFSIATVVCSSVFTNLSDVKIIQLQHMIVKLSAY